MKRTLHLGIWACALVIGLLWVTNANAAPVRKKSLELYVGDKWVIPSKGVVNYAAARDGVVDISLASEKAKDSDFLVTALAPGKTIIVFIMEDGSQVRYEVVVHPMRVSERDNVRLDFYFVELSRDKNRRVGIGWPGAILATTNVDVLIPIRPSGSTTATASIASQVLPRLDLAQDNGWAKVLREASVIVSNGGESSFESGGEENFRVSGVNGGELQSVQFGSRINAKPRYDRTTGRLDLELNAVVSELTEQSVDGVPGRAFTSLNTVVNLELGQSIILAGIHSKSVARASEGLPLLSQIPVLGYIFGSQTARETEVENLIFIVPTVMQAVDLDQRDRVLEAQRAFRKYEGGANGRLLYRKAHAGTRRSRPLSRSAAKAARSRQGEKGQVA